MEALLLFVGQGFSLDNQGNPYLCPDLRGLTTLEEGLVSSDFWLMILSHATRGTVMGKTSITLIAYGANEHASIAGD